MDNSHADRQILLQPVKITIQTTIKLLVPESQTHEYFMQFDFSSASLPIHCVSDIRIGCIPWNHILVSFTKLTKVSCGEDGVALRA